MKELRIGILGAADIAYKKFLPALKKTEGLSFAGIASRNKEKCIPFIEQFDGKYYENYEDILSDPEIDCIYVPLPPALHAYWGARVLNSDKHLFMEKPFTTSATDTKYIIELAKKKNLVVHENYMFQYHKQITAIEKIISEGKLGNIRMLRTAFTFPFRGMNDFRYNKELGGGALLDCGGYPISLALRLLGNTAQLHWSDLQKDSFSDVDTFGSAVFKNSSGLTAHVFFGMNDTYRCDLEVWGSEATLIANRVFTAPANLDVSFSLKTKNGVESIDVGSDDQFLNSIYSFKNIILSPELRASHYTQIEKQSYFIDLIKNKE